VISYGEKSVANVDLTARLHRASGLYEAGELEACEQACRAILTVVANQFDALCLLSRVKCRQGDDREAYRLLSKALRHNPSMTAAGWRKCGLILAALKRPEEAIASYDRAIALDPDSADVRCNRANVLCDLGRLEEALAGYDDAIALDCDHFTAHNNRGSLLRELRRFEEAVASHDRAIALDPDHANAHYNRANALCDLGRLEEAVAGYDRAIARDARHIAAYNNRGNALRDLKRFDEALASFRQAIALKPDLASAHNNIGNMLGELGRLEEARQVFESAIARTPSTVSHYYHLSALKRFSAGDPHIAAMERLARGMTALSEEARIRLHFALGKAYADVGEHERSFRHIGDGNALNRRRVVYNEADTMRSMERIRAVFTEEMMRSRAGAGDPSPVPVFIVGMPRSGSTLVEQILASHPAVFGAGELRDFGRCVAGLRDTGGAPVLFPEGVPTLTPERLCRLGTDYLERVRAARPTAQRVTDKMPGNFNLVGLIHLALPNARIIHTRRDPIDTCYSCFTRLFAAGHQYAYDLGELGRYYRAYEVLMAHWRRVLPAGVMLEVQYEEVVADVETQARRIIDHCGIDWDDACLAFHNSGRAVRTFSSPQVRRPIYRDSIGRWRPHAARLAPLLDELADTGIPAS
jgi:tetratricopeptide (TPR) repeat protein